MRAKLRIKKIPIARSIFPKENAMGPSLLLTAALCVGQVQEVQVSPPEQPAPTGLFGRLRSWSWRGPSTAEKTDERPVLSKIQDRLGAIFGRGPSNAAGGPANGRTTLPNRQRFTTNEPPILEQYANPKAAPTPVSNPR
jgi:hypothetical protein